MTVQVEALTYEALKAKCDHLEQINAQTLQVKLTMAETIKELTDRVNALAVENAALSAALSLISGSYGLSPHIQSMCAVDTPTTDAALAAIQAQGVEKALAVVSACRENICPGGLSENRQYEESIVQPHLDGIADELGNLIIELREAK
ncbi:hypothetical protein OSC13_18830 [Serratia marcescens]|uniref:hypothetical protein n=1 Tax=Serratia marcescens TaxID=615 RepID=UPI00112EEB91|nr:hypothetical protein [Serratia marcescens]MDS0779969.1 hypothetical protein [Serratia marcescens]TPV69945.1 hypothetical protein FJ699_05430 [Serratia marcescens]